MVVYSFWSRGEDALPTARKVRLTLDSLDEAHAANQIVFVNGAGNPARAVIAAGCWLARHRSSTTRTDPQTARLGWLEDANGASGRTADAFVLDEVERALVCDWPAGKGGEPVLTQTELLDDDEVYPTATIEYWLRVLPSVRFYPDGRDSGRRIDLPVLDEVRLSDGGDIHLEMDDLRSGTWIGERTLRLLDGSAVVFMSPHKRRDGRR